MGDFHHLLLTLQQTFYINLALLTFIGRDFTFSSNLIIVIFTSFESIFVIYKRMTHFIKFIKLCCHIFKNPIQPYLLPFLIAKAILYH